jgi:hypothetical protein
MYAAGESEEALARMIGVHPARMARIMATAMEEIEGRTRQLAGRELRAQLELLDQEIGKTVLKLLDRCPACGGDEELQISCPHCEGEGYAEKVKHRLAALQRIDRLARRRIKLLGLDKAPQQASSGARQAPDWPPKYEHFSDEELEEEIELLKQSLEDNGHDQEDD